MEDKKRKELGEYIKNRRISLGLSLLKLSNLAKMSISDLHTLENGARQKVNPFQLQEIATILNLDYKVLYRIIGFLNDKDFEGNNIKNISYTSKEEFIKSFANFYPNISENELVKFLEFLSLSKTKRKKIIDFLDYIKKK